MSHGSQQLRRFRIARRDGASIEEAAEASGIDLVEAKMHAADDDRNPPPPEAYVLLGHNSGNEKPMTQAIAADEVRLLIERYERLDEEEKGLKDDKKDVMSEAKSRGFNVKVMKKLIAMRKRDPNDRTTEEAELALYAEALGMQLGFAL